MKNYIKRFFNNEILSYLFFGVATTVVAVLTRMLCYALTSNELLATALGNIAGILFAFATNDTIVFKQERTGWGARFVKFALARLSTFLLDMGLTLIFVTTFPNIIGQFVHNDIKAVNTIETLFAQIVIIVLNYVFSKVFVFKNKSKK
ncbi:GtrA family protein [Streptococcus anginosus]|uniref:GtrA family protein n=1 Tax=Streptococcus anginosus TaxID=1328 RepID=A0A3S4NIF9_STRAP|nr:GtrA family protein [Streptococcus anginosus]GAD39663.1 predicted membrane protein [Streptococcus intermedius SK54 = ATCC 27335]EGL47833.1 GtrA-like protein [Streptococcus anginosus SK52 = DSM 20563]MBZ2157128.1 GtrA family protein [Streptococcus anginosus]ORE83656.1 polysaccharide synthesis protein GtrA [Streptococcus anginosus SK52 = DSM 20563]UEB02479.1 GtrA family protein [Streptococcus anginosus subsp. anginosus]